jgi:hypothetical protein
MVIMLTAIITGVSFGCNKNNKVMNGADNMTMAIPKIPPIDTAVPFKTETATFAILSRRLCEIPLD